MEGANTTPLDTGKGYRFIYPLLPRPQVLNRQLEDVPPAKEDIDTRNEIRLRNFPVETIGGKPVLTCDVVVRAVALGRLPLSELELPCGVSAFEARG